MTLIQTEPKKIYIRVEAQPVTIAGIYHSPDLGLISLSSDGTNWITIADKNLGATQVYNDGDVLSEANCGKYYQWGNNYGFPFTGSISTSSGYVDASTYGPGNYYSSSTFYKNNGRWDNPDNNNLRGDITDTNAARQGPCNNGFHIPSYSEMINLWLAFVNTCGANDTNFKNCLLCPLCGWRSNSNGAVTANSKSYRWTTTQYNINYAYMFSSNNGQIEYMYKCCGYNIRPFANTPIQPDETRTVLYPTS